MLRSILLFLSAVATSFVRAGVRFAVLAIQFARSGTQSFTTVRTVTLSRTSCYFDVSVPFPDSGSVRLRWQQPGAGLDESRSVAITGA